MRDTGIVVFCLPGPPWRYSVWSRSPFVLLLRISLAPADLNGTWKPGITLAAFDSLADPEVLGALFNSVELAALVAIISLGLGFPLTYLITRMRSRAQVVWLVFLLVTLTLSDVLIAFSWQVMLSKRVGLSNILVVLGLRDEPASLTPSGGAVVACLSIWFCPSRS